MALTEQEQFWKGEFGDAYSERTAGRIEANRLFFKTVLKAIPMGSVLELGCGNGENLAALREMWGTMVLLSGVEINHRSAEAARACADFVFEDSIFAPAALKTKNAYTLSMVKGVLIHIAPRDLPRAYATLYETSYRYILIAEYYSKTRREIDYRGHQGRLWTADFGGEMMDAYPDLKLLSCTFHYDRLTGQDNVTAWLFEKP